MSSTTSERNSALTKLFHQHAFANEHAGRAGACAVEVAEMLGATVWDVDPRRGAAGCLVGEGWTLDLAPLCAQLRETSVGQLGAITRSYLAHALTQAGFARPWVRPMSPDDREALGKVVHQAASAYGVALGRGPSDPWELIDPVDREGACRVGVAVATSVGITPGAAKPEGVRYRRVSLYGHVSLGVCRIEDIEVAGVKMLRATTLCDATPRVEEFPGTSVYTLGVLTPEAALEEARKAAERRAARVREEEAKQALEASARARRVEDRARAVVTVTVAGDHVELRPTYDGLRAPHLLDFAHAEVGEAFAAQGLTPFYVPHLRDREETPGGDATLQHVGALLDGFGPSVQDVVRAVTSLGFREVVRLPDQPARAENDDIPFDDAAAAVADHDEPSGGGA